MNTYIALLRGINVGGYKKILMTDLKMLIEKLGFLNVQTYIQSGNVIFRSDSEASVKGFSENISEAILEEYGWEVPVLVNTPSELKLILDDCPFPQEKKEKSYFVLLQWVPSSSTILETEKINYPNEEFIITNSCVYLYSELGAAKAKLSTNFFERKLKVKATARNYNTMVKLLSLAT